MKRVQNIFLRHEQIMKSNKDILRVVFRSARYDNMSHVMSHIRIEAKTYPAIPA